MGGCVDRGSPRGLCFVGRVREEPACGRGQRCSVWSVDAWRRSPRRGAARGSTALRALRTTGPVVGRPQSSWTRIKGESDVTRRWGYGSVEAGEGSWVGADGGSPEGDRSRADAAAMGSGALAPGQRWSARRNGVVLRLLRSEPLDAVSREVGVEGPIAWRGGTTRAPGRSRLGAGERWPSELDAAKRHIGEVDGQRAAAVACPRSG